MKKSYRIFSAALSLLTVASVMASCGSDTKNPAVTSSADPVTTAVTEKETTEQDVRNAIPDDLPEKDYGGASFQILYTPVPEDYNIEEETGDILNDAKFRRQRTVEERFNIDISSIGYGGLEEDIAMFKSSVLAGSDDYALAALHQIQAGPGLIMDHLVRDWNEMPMVNLSKPWWNQHINETINIMGKQFYIAGYITLPSPFCMLYNKQMLNDLDMEDLYTVVNEGRWTLDYLLDMSKAASKDLDGNGVFEEGVDRYGLSFNHDNETLNFMFASDIQSVILKDGVPTPNVNTEKMQTLVEKVYALRYDDNRTLRTDYTTLDVGYNAFKEGRVLIRAGSVGSAASLRDSNVDFGIIPYPKFDEKQDGYYTHVDAYNGMLCVGQSTQDIERSGIITEALAAETYKQVMPVYYEKALGEKYFRDETSYEMMNMIFDGIIYDFGYIFDFWHGCTWTLPYMIRDKKTDVAGYWSKKEKAVNKWYEKLYKKVEEYDG